MSKRLRRMDEVRTKEKAIVEKTTVVAKPDGNVLRGGPGRCTVQKRQQKSVRELALERESTQLRRVVQGGPPRIMRLALRGARSRSMSSR
jgi:hypothetical protein